jgi:hypothetical protein
MSQYLGNTEHLHDTLGESQYLVTKSGLQFGKLLAPKFTTVAPYELYSVTQSRKQLIYLEASASIYHLPTLNLVYLMTLSQLHRLYSTEW